MNTNIWHTRKHINIELLLWLFLPPLSSNGYQREPYGRGLATVMFKKTGLNWNKNKLQNLTTDSIWEGGKKKKKGQSWP